jgi:hypothetical protein
MTLSKGGDVMGKVTTVGIDLATKWRKASAETGIKIEWQV